MTLSHKYGGNGDGGGGENFPPALSVSFPTSLLYLCLCRNEQPAHGWALTCPTKPLPANLRLFYVGAYSRSGQRSLNWLFIDKPAAA